MDLTFQALESAGPLQRKDPENPVFFRSYTTMPTILHVWKTLKTKHGAQLKRIVKEGSSDGPNVMPSVP